MNEQNTSGICKIGARISKAYWGEAVTTAAYVHNRVVTSSTGITPFERWYKRKPDVSQFIWMHGICISA